jgi:hypothetical protein
LKEERRAKIQLNKDFADMQKTPATEREEYKRSHSRKDVGEY